MLVILLYFAKFGTIRHRFKELLKNYTQIYLKFLFDEQGLARFELSVTIVYDLVLSPLN